MTSWPVRSSRNLTTDVECQYSWPKEEEPPNQGGRKGPIEVHAGRRSDPYFYEEVWFLNFDVPSCIGAPALLSLCEVLLSCCKELLLLHARHALRAAGSLATLRPSFSTGRAGGVHQMTTRTRIWIQKRTTECRAVTVGW
jgi:hypothetical protein